MGLRLVTAAGRDAFGARVTIVTADGRRLLRRARADGSYASANDPRVLAGLGSSAGPVRVEVAWPDGTSGIWDGIPAGRYTTLRQAGDSR